MIFRVCMKCKMVFGCVDKHDIKKCVYCALKCNRNKDPLQVTGGICDTCWDYRTFFKSRVIKS